MFRRMNRHILGVCSELPYPPSKDNFSRWGTTMLETVAHVSRGPHKPFHTACGGTLDMKDREIQFSFLKVVWLEKLLEWKMRTAPPSRRHSYLILRINCMG